MDCASSFDSCCLLLLAATLHRFFFPYTVCPQEPFDIMPTNPILAECWEKFMASYGLCSHVLQALQVNTARHPSRLNHFIFSRITPACWKKRRKIDLAFCLDLRKEFRHVCVHTASKLSHFKADGQLPLKCIKNTVRSTPRHELSHGYPVSLGGVFKPMEISKNVYCLLREKKNKTKPFIFS